jgi:hypothetical protein
VLHYELTGTGVESVIVEPGPYPSRLLPNSPAPEDVQRLAGYGEMAGLRDRSSNISRNSFLLRGLQTHRK